MRNEDPESSLRSLRQMLRTLQCAAGGFSRRNQTVPQFKGNPNPLVQQKLTPDNRSAVGLFVRKRLVVEWSVVSGAGVIEHGDPSGTPAPLTTNQLTQLLPRLPLDVRVQTVSMRVHSHNPDEVVHLQMPHRL